MGSYLSSSRPEIERFGNIRDMYNINDKVLHINYKPDEASKKLKRAYTLQHYFPKAYDQKGLNSSTACAIASIIEYNQKRTAENSDDPTLNYFHKIPSILYLYYISKDEDKKLLNCGTSIRDSLKRVNRHGITMESNFPYNPENLSLKPAIKQEYILFKRMFDYKKIERGIHNFKYCISELQNPILFGFNVYESFDNLLKWDNDGTMPIPKVKEKLLGSQTGVCIGYSEKKKSFVIRNSWGPNWKNDGYFFMPYSYFCSPNCSDFWIFNIKSSTEYDGFEKQPQKKRNHKKHSNKKTKKKRKSRQEEEDEDNSSDSNSDYEEDYFEPEEKVISFDGSDPTKIKTDNDNNTTTTTRKSRRRRRRRSKKRKNTISPTKSGFLIQSDDI